MKNIKIDISKIWEKKFKADVEHQKFDNFLKTRLNEFLKHLDKKSRILDIGCGAGEKTSYIASKGYDIVGIDTSKTAITYAKRNLKGIQFYRRSALNTKFAENNFDAIISVAVYHCLFKKDRKKYVKEINRILKKGGFLFQLVLSSADETMKSGKEIELNTFLKSGTPFHLFTENELRNDFKNFKFIQLKHYKKKIKNKTIACYVMTLKKI